MVDNKLDDLERKIGITRARLKANLAAMGSEYAIDDLKGTIKAEVIGAKDEAIEFAKGSAKEFLENAYRTVKDKAVANPAAAVMIGAGIGWRLWKNPPVAAALAGVGLYSLFSRPENDPIRTAAGRISEGVAEVAATAVEASATTVEAVSQAAQDLQGNVRSIAEGAGERAKALVRSVSTIDSQRAGLTDEGQRQVLLSLAGAAVAAAVGIAVHKRLQR